MTTASGNAKRASLTGPLLAFCLLPSLSLHPSQFERFIPAPVYAHADELPALHRLWSAALIEQAALEPLATFDDAALPLAMLPADRLAQWLSLAGVTLAGQRIRRCIVRSEVELLRAQLGDAVLDFARRRAPAFYAGLPDETACSWSLSAAAEHAAALGEALFARAFGGATRPVAQRALLRLPTDAVQRAAALPLAADAALRLSLSLLQELDPVWLSSFPASL